METASAKKLAICLSSCSSDAASSTGESSKASAVSSELTGEHGAKGYRLVSYERLRDAVTMIGACSTCGYPLTLKEDLATRRGIVSRLAISCTNRVCDKDTLISDSYASDAKSLNSRSIMAMRAIGRGQSSLESFFGLMDMLPPVTSRDHLATQDSTRIKRSRYRETELAKQRRKSESAVENGVEETHIAEEGTT